MAWPQLTYLALTMIGLGITFKRHGQLRPESDQRYNFFTTAIGTLLALGLLYAGGFFSP